MKQERTGRYVGIALTAVCHLLLVLWGSFSGFSYLWPPPEEKSLLIEFEPETLPEEKPRPDGVQPRSENARPDKGLELVKAAQSPFEGQKENIAPEATTGPDGDVETPEPVREIDRRALFQAADNPSPRDTLAPQVAEKVSEGLAAGHPAGNTEEGRVTGTPNARLKGRSTMGLVPPPDYPVQASGTVVVRIWVDQYGTVQRAMAGSEGTTVTDKALWNAARNAALNTHFNLSSDAPPLQEGSITYIFKLK